MLTLSDRIGPENSHKPVSRNWNSRTLLSIFQMLEG